MFFATKSLIGIILLLGAIFAAISYFVFFVEFDFTQPGNVRIDQQQLDDAADRAADRATDRLQAEIERKHQESEQRHRQHNKSFNEGLPGWQDE
jgi:hypothetical protein